MEKAGGASTSFLRRQADIGEESAAGVIAQQGEEIRQEVERKENLFTDKGMKVLRGLVLPEREAKLLGVLPKRDRHIEEWIDETK